MARALPLGNSCRVGIFLHRNQDSPICLSSVLRDSTRHEYRNATRITENPIMPSSCGPAPSRGFTLIEALVVIAVAGILASLAVPSFQNLIARNRLSAGATDVLTGLKVAKNEAIRRNQSMRFCINPTTRAWRVATVGGDEFRVGAINGALTIHTASLDGAAVPDHQCVRFRPDGLAYGSGLITNGNITLGASGNSRVINIRTGAIHVG